MPFSIDAPPAAIEEKQPVKRPIKMPESAAAKRPVAPVDSKSPQQVLDREARLKEISQRVAKKAAEIKSEVLKQLKNPNQWDAGAYQCLQTELAKLASTPQLQELIYTKLTADPELKKIQKKGEFLLGDETIFDTTPKPGSLAAKKANSEQRN